MPEKAFQDYYPDQWSHCYGCGRLNEQGLQIKSYWDEETGETYSIYHPRPHHIAIPGYVYGGLIASLVDCHGTGSAAAAAYQAAGRRMDDGGPPIRFVTGSLHIDYLKPTPLGPALDLRGVIREVKGRKVIVDITLSVEGEITARGEVVAVQVPDHWSLITGEKEQDELR
ncbi:MAG: PaaI family thioesterase [Chloroflexi bacterium]|nr:PaaI family thioesterase [Chloroflexota bacterium]